MDLSAFFEDNARIAKREYARNYRETHREELKLKKRKYDKKQKDDAIANGTWEQVREKRNQYAREYYQKNKERLKANRKRNRASKKTSSIAIQTD